MHLYYRARRYVPILALLLAVPSFAGVLAESEITGRVQARPAGAEGEWLIAGRVVVATPATEIDADGGAIAVGDCVRAEGSLDLGGAFIATEISRRDGEDCGGVPSGDAAAEVEFRGFIEVLPDEGLTGTWTVSGRTVVVAEFTELEQDDGVGLAVGSCVEVEGSLRDDGAVVATSVEAEDDDRCSSPGMDDPSEDEVQGIVESVPALGLLGELVVSGVVVEVTGSTEIKAELGPLVAGACVKAEGSTTEEGVLVAREVRVLATGACGAANGVSIEFTGQVASGPSGGVEGEWMIAGRTVIVDAATELYLELGPLEPGVCVRVEGSPSAAGVAAVEIRVLGESCPGLLALDLDLSFQGRVQTAPEEGVEGTWRISGRTVLVDADTQVELNGSTPAAGLCVEVQGEWSSPGVFAASRLAVSGENCGFGPGGPSREVEITGRVEAVPPSGRNGRWVINGIDVVVSAMTEIDDAPAAGSCVRVEGAMNGEGALVAREIEPADDAGCPTGGASGAVEFTGLVTAMPTEAGFVGDWTIGGFSVSSTGDTEIDQSDGPLRIGACVEVEGVAEADGSVTASKLDVESAAGLCIRAIVHAASFEGEAVSPGQIVSIFGLGLGPGEGIGLEVAEGRVRTNLRGLRVTFDGDEAPILFASATQVNVVAPYSLEGKTRTRVRVSWAGGFSKSLELAVRDASPGILTLTQTGEGQAAALNVGADGSVSINGSDNPASPGQIVSLFATGEGQTNPPGVDGEVVAAGNLPRPEANVAVTIGGQPAVVLYAGGAPGLVSGVLQVNVEIPPGLEANGDVDVTLTVGDVESAAGVTIAVE